MKVGDLVKLSGYRGKQYTGIGLVTKVYDSVSRQKSHILFGVRWLDGISGEGSYHTDELEVYSESR